MAHQRGKGQHNCSKRETQLEEMSHYALTLGAICSASSPQAPYLLLFSY